MDRSGHDLAVALRRFKTLDHATQMRLARETALTRGAELTLAYRNVVMVAAGHKYKRRKDGRERRIELPCVVFVVRRKWTADESAARDPQRLPAGLLAFADDALGRRVLCAVPTDVQHVDRFCGARATAQRAVFVDTPALEFGTITCAVELRGAGAKRRLAMSALHVLSPLPELDPVAMRTGAEITRLARGVPPAQPPLLGRSVAIGGRLRSGTAISFDVQLAEVLQGAWATLRPMLADLALSPTVPFVASADDFHALSREGFELLVPDNHPDAGFEPRPPMLARFDTFMPPSFSVAYDVTEAGGHARRRVHHFELLQLVLASGRRTLQGDSGCPVVFWRDDGSATLVGMHIAGDGKLSYVLPAWQLFDLDNYWQRPPGASLRPVLP